MNYPKTTMGNENQERKRMIATALTDLFVDDFVEGDFESTSFNIEVTENFLTVDRRHQHTSLIESKTIKVEADVIIYVHKKESSLYDLVCHWLWREPTRFENLSHDQAIELQQIISQIAHSLRKASNQNNTLKGIKVGNQIWSDRNLFMDAGLETAIQSELNKMERKDFGYLYTKAGAERVASIFPDWRIPSQEDYVELFSFFGSEAWDEITKNMKFRMGGFKSVKIPENEMKQFLEFNSALKLYNSGFYWTSDVTPDYSGKKSLEKHTYMYLNEFKKTFSFEQSVQANNNQFSLRLIRK